MKLKTNTRNANSVRCNESRRQSPNFGSQYSNNLLKNLELQRHKRLGSTAFSPYLEELEKRKKMRSVVYRNESKEKQMRKVARQSSSKRFRINSSIYSPSNEHFRTIQHKSHHNSSRQMNNLIKDNTIKEYEQDISIYMQKPFIITNQSPSRPAFYSQLYEKLKSKSKRQNKFRRGKFVQSSLDGKSDNLISQNSTILKLGFTANGMASGCTTISHQKAQKRNFRRNKFDLKSQVVQNTIERTKFKQLKQYASASIQKKESNISLMQQLHYQTEQDIEIQSKNTRIKMKKQLDKSLQKSAQQYFDDNYNRRRFILRNQIDTYISTVKNPSKIRSSQASTFIESTTNKINSNHVSKNGIKSLNYNFDLEEDVALNNIVIQQSCSNTQNNQSLLVEQDNQFNRAKKQAQKSKYQKCQVIGISWSKESLQFNKGNTQYI